MQQYDEKYFKKVSAYKRVGGYEKIKTGVLAYYEATFGLVRSVFPDILDGEGKTALEVGCAFGYGVDLLGIQGFEAYGCDVSFYAIMKARELSGRTNKFKVIDVMIPQILSENFLKRFDLVTCFDVLEHLSNPLIAIDNIFSILNPGAFMLMATPNPCSLSPFKFLGKDPTHVNEREPLFWKSLMHKAGFSEINVITVHPMPLLHRFIKRQMFMKAPELIGYKTIIIGKK